MSYVIRQQIYVIQFHIHTPKGGLFKLLLKPGRGLSRMLAQWMFIKEKAPEKTKQKKVMLFCFVVAVFKCQWHW